MIPAEQVVSLFQKAYQEGWGYIYGKRGQTWTKADQAAARRAQTVRWGRQWIGRRVTDCSGLFVWALSTLGGSVYHGSHTIWKRHCAARGKLVEGRRGDGLGLRPGTAVFRLTGATRSHIGLYVGGGLVIEAKSTREGVRTSPIAAWQEWGELSAVTYPLRVAEDSALSARLRRSLRPTLRRGDAGEDVRLLQDLLTALGRPLKADGLFGVRTAEALRAYQTDRSLTADGVCGPRTWTLLRAQYLHETESEEAS